MAIFVSGNGTNMDAIIQAVNDGDINADIVLVFSNRRKANALKKAEEAGIPTLCLEPKDYTNKQSFDRDVVIHLKKENIDFIVLAGYMKLLTPFFIKQYPRRILNVHPSLLPSFKGANGIKDAYTYGAKVTGVTIHFVDEKMDHGPIIMQDSVKIQERDTLETLEAKIHTIEHRVYPKAISLFAEGRLKITGRRVQVLEKGLDELKPNQGQTP
ncbi:MAG: phosphoribosylglycinamide formyltransferase [Candidatus Omnitrophica bacterium]|nr:phosphoribosylglycinamide formyltransferase [Candidatus Omnitrophota bacterium]